MASRDPFQSEYFSNPMTWPRTCFPPLLPALCSAFLCISYPISLSEESIQIRTTRLELKV